MIVDAIVKEIHGKLEIFSPKFRHGRSIFILPMSFSNVPIKLVTEKSEIPVSRGMLLNNVPISRDLFNQTNIQRGMWVKSAKVIYIVIAEQLL